MAIQTTISRDEQKAACKRICDFYLAKNPDCKASIIKLSDIRHDIREKGGNQLEFAKQIVAERKTRDLINGTNKKEFNDNLMGVRKATNNIDYENRGTVPVKTIEKNYSDIFKKSLRPVGTDREIKVGSSLTPVGKEPMKKAVTSIGFAFPKTSAIPVYSEKTNILNIICTTTEQVKEALSQLKINNSIK